MKDLFGAIKDQRVWVLGLILSVPLSILASYMKDGIDWWLAERSIESALQLQAAILEEFEHVETMYNDRSVFKEYLLWVAIRAIMVGALAGMVTSGFHIIGAAFRVGLRWRRFYIPREVGGEISLVFALIPSVVGGLLVFDICSEGLTAFNRVNNFGEYNETVLQMLESLSENQ